jgi:hypothetical protein
MINLSGDKDPWFAPKRYGYGAGLPIKWKGWVTIALYLTALVGIGMMSKMQNTPPRIAAFILFLIVTAVALSICRSRTEGGWKWRWGEKD